MKYEITEEVLRAVINYLNLQPRGQVNNLVLALEQSKPIEEEENDDS